jgi:hypothetical protein
MKGSWKFVPNSSVDYFQDLLRVLAIFYWQMSKTKTAHEPLVAAGSWYVPPEA